MRAPRPGIPILGALAGVLLTLLAAADARAQEVPKSGEKWSSVGDADLLVLGQTSPRRVEEIARDLALGRAALLSITGVPDHRPPYPTTVIVLRDDLALRSYARSAQGPADAVAPLTALDRQGRVIALSLESAETQLPVARELLAGDQIDQLLGDPGWVRTGLAALMGRMERAGKSSEAPRLVERAGTEASAASAAGPRASGWPTPAAVRAARPNEYRDAALGLVRTLANPQSERSSQFRRYLALLRGGAASDAAFEECFFGSFDALYTAAAQAQARGAPPIELEAPAPAAAGARELAWDRAVLALGDLLVRAVPWNTVAAELHFRAVLERHPDDAAALRGIALVRELDHRVEDAAELWGKSLAAAPDDRVTPMLDGWSRLDRFRLAVGTRRGWEDPLPDQVAAARDLFARALAPDPAAASSPHALHGFGATFLFARAGFDAGLAALERAARLLPGDDEIAADLALLRAHAGDQEGAWELRRQRLLDRATPELDALVEKLLAEEALHTANQLLLVDQKPPEAMALVRGAAAEVRNPDTRQQLQDVLAQMEQVAAKLADNGLYERFIDDFNRAKDLAGQRRFAEARRLLEPYAAESVDPVVRDPARDALRQIDQVDRH